MTIMSIKDQKEAVEFCYQLWLQYQSHPEWDKAYYDKLVAFLRRNGRNVEK